MTEGDIEGFLHGAALRNTKHYEAALGEIDFEPRYTKPCLGTNPALSISFRAP